MYVRAARLAEFAAMRGISVRTVTRRIADGTYRAIKEGGCILIPADQFEEYRPEPLSDQEISDETLDWLAPLYEDD